MLFSAFLFPHFLLFFVLNFKKYTAKFKHFIVYPNTTVIYVILFYHTRNQFKERARYAAKDWDLRNISPLVQR